ncbi:MAG TPA: protein phosphatase 2C domain-containing protein [Azospirillum sp.]|nr:protein phosphatase 2C domain-containing protein [Azospirillum sp.]
MPQTDTLAMITAGLTDVGRMRARNEDSFGIEPDLGLAVVCDGMGGHAGGDIASRTATEAIVDFLAEFVPANGGAAIPADLDLTLAGGGAIDTAVQNAVATVRSAVQVANRRLAVLNTERGYPDGRGMGTTVVGTWRLDGSDKLVAFHAGDSRLYRLRGGELTQLTRDHSLYQVWLDQGSRGPAPQRNIIVRALGTMQDVEPDVSVHGVRADDIYMLCSDGLTGMLPDPAIAAILRDTGRGDLDTTCRHLVSLANERGGHDNITVVLSRFDSME